MNKTLSQQWYLTKLCFQAAPGYMALHIFESMKLQVSIFFESTWTLNYILEVVEQKGPWQKIFWCMVLLLGAIAVSTVTFSVYTQRVLPKLKPILYHAFRIRIYEHTREIDLACYDDPDFYQGFILAAQEADTCVDEYLKTTETYCSNMTQLVLVFLFCMKINPVIAAVPLFLLPLQVLMIRKENREAVAARMEQMVPEQKREYLNRVFYLADYARDLRMNPRMSEKCRQDFEQTAFHHSCSWVEGHG